MRISTRVTGAFIIGIALIALVVTYKSLTSTQVPPGTLAIVAKDAAPRSFIKTSDEDGDGIPDWQETLQRTDPVLITLASTTYKTSDTLTDQFAVDFFQDMVRSKNYGVFGDNPDELVTHVSEQFKDAATDVFYGAKDIVVDQDTSQAAIRNYANAMAAIVLAGTVPVNTPNQAEIMQQAFATNNPAALAQLDVYIDVFDTMIESFLITPVPSTYVKEHLDLINIYLAINNDMKGMRLAFEDPLLAIVRIKRYQEDASSLYVALLNMQKKTVEDNVVFQQNDPAYAFLIKE